MLRGLPGSGKTTYALELIYKSIWPIKRINNDDLRSMLDGGKYSKENEKYIRAIRDNLISNFLSGGIDVIVDNLNFGSHEERYRSLAARYKADFQVKDFNTSVYECVRRDSLRPKPVGSKVIWRWYEDYILPKERKRWEEKSSLPEAIIVDLDGTLATRDMSNKAVRGHFDLTRVGEDLIVTPVNNIICDWAYMHTEGSVLFVSGREEVCREETTKYLLRAGWRVDAEHKLFMRSLGDQRDDCIVKKEIYEKHIEQNYNIVAVFDDRPRVVRMWRELGLFVFDVGRGVDF